MTNGYNAAETAVSQKDESDVAWIVQLLDEVKNALGLHAKPGRWFFTYANSVEMVLGGVGKLVIEVDTAVGDFPIGYNAEHDILIIKCLPLPEYLTRPIQTSGE